MESTITQLRLPLDLARRYDELARETGQSREDVMVEALGSYLDQRAEDDARLRAAMAAADRGDVVDAAVVDAEAEAFLRGLGVTPDQLAAIEAEVRREADAAYGLCE
jgi:predicted transcriptional regulator